jgi:hypothetical protein
MPAVSQDHTFREAYASPEQTPASLLHRSHCIDDASDEHRARAGIGTHVAQMVSINEGRRLPWIEDVCLGGADHQGNGQNRD